MSDFFILFVVVTSNAKRQTTYVCTCVFACMEHCFVCACMCVYVSVCVRVRERRTSYGRTDERTILRDGLVHHCDGRGRLWGGGLVVVGDLAVVVVARRAFVEGTHARTQMHANFFPQNFFQRNTINALNSLDLEQVQRFLIGLDLVQTV